MARRARVTSNTAITAVIGLAIVLALVLGVARLVRALGLAPAQPQPGSGRARRLCLLESLHLDPRRRLLLARCGEHEVLILTGGPQDLLLTMPQVEADACRRDAP
jgi:flagellar protein FliO/FliZ